MARKEFLDYVWKYCVEPQLGYSFSINHTLPYSIIALQEANLATRWNPLYWQCACLCVNSGNYAGDVGDLSGDDEGETEEAEEGVDTNNDKTTVKRQVAPNYGKISRAIANAQMSGVSIELPDVNMSQADFIPDINNNSIFYSLRAVNVISDNLFDSIILNRPYTSLVDFIQKNNPGRMQMIGLIKAGCFDALCKKSRMVIMGEYLQYEADKEFPLKDKLTLVQIRKAIETGWRNPDYGDIVRIIRFKQYIDQNQQDPEADSSNKRYVLSDDKCINFFKTFIMSHLNASKWDYTILPGGYISIKLTTFKRVFDKLVAPLVTYFNTEEGRKEYQKLLQDEFIQNLLTTKCGGSLSHWEMETMGFYHGEHELARVNRGKYGIGKFLDLPERDEGQKPIALVGTVIDRNNSRHTITLLTPEGVVDVKAYGSLYSQYNSRISNVDPTTKKKTVIDESWFTRGTLLIVYGVRKENMFHLRREYSGKFPKIIGRINEVHSDGTIDVQYSRNTK